MTLFDEGIKSEINGRDLKVMEGIKSEITYHTAAIITSIFVELYLKKTLNKIAIFENYLGK